MDNEGFLPQGQVKVKINWSLFSSNNNQRFAIKYLRQLMLKCNARSSCDWQAHSAARNVGPMNIFHQFFLRVGNYRLHMLKKLNTILGCCSKSPTIALVWNQVQ